MAFQIVYLRPAIGRSPSVGVGHSYDIIRLNQCGSYAGWGWMGVKVLLSISKNMIRVVERSLTIRATLGIVLSLGRRGGRG